MTSTLDSSAGTLWAASLIGVSKAYKHFKLRNIHFSVECGTVAGLIGPNGAGKSTTMRILMGLVQPDEGAVLALGKSISSNEAEAKRDIGYFSDDMRLYKPESIGWHMQFVRSLYPNWDDVYADQLLNRFGLIPQQIVKGLSHGQRVKAMLLMILARRPKLLILDEPTNGLDPVAKHEVITELMRVVEDESRTILYSSHNTQDVEQISDSITFIDRGQVIASSNRDEFLEKWKRIKLHASDEWTVPSVQGLRLESRHRNLHVLSCSQFCDEVPVQLAAPGVLIEAIEPMTLEEIFVQFCYAWSRRKPVMNLQAIRILFLKDLFLSRRYLFAYFVGGLAASAIACLPQATFAFIGFILVITVAIAAGIHLIGTLLLSETIDQTKLFVMSLPVSLLDYSIGKISVVLTTYLIPWASMFACLVIATVVMGKQGSLVALPAIFFFLLAGFALQLVTAVISESVGWTICVMVACNVALNVLLMKLFEDPEVSAATKSDVLTWPNVVLQIIAVEVITVLLALVVAFLIQTRKRDLV